MLTRCVRYRLWGMVQGVGLRVRIWRYASGHGLKGWVRNLPDGSVEAVVEGTKTAVGDFDDMLQYGLPGVSFSLIESSDEPALGAFKDFRIL